eukprot:7956732-Ditylum_brightwellii.AAC.1
MEDFPPFINTNQSSTPPQLDQNSSTTYNTPTSSKIATLRKETEEFKVSICAKNSKLHSDNSIHHPHKVRSTLNLCSSTLYDRCQRNFPQPSNITKSQTPKVTSHINGNNKVYNMDKV